MAISFIIFLGIRGFIFNVNYDFNLGAGEFLNYYIYWFDGTANLRILWIFFTFTILWIGIFGYLIHRWKIDVWFFFYFYGIFALIIISLLSHKITRVGYFLVFIYLPIFLRFQNDFKGSER